MAAEGAQDQVLDLRDVSRIVRRRKAWLIVPSVIGLVASIALAFALPAEYEATAIVVVEGEEIPPELARTTVTESTETRYGSLRLEIMTRDNLIAIIDEYELFADKRHLPREELVELLRERISIEPLPPAIVDPRKPVELNSFIIAFRWPDPKQAAAVANRLTRDFIAANLKLRASSAQGASEFIAVELGKTRAQLAEIAQRITTYKERYLDELPEQLPVNRQRLELARRTLVDDEARLQTARSQVNLLQHQIGEMRLASGSSEEDPVLRKKGLELHLNAMLAHGKTEKHPDVAMTRAEIAALDEVIAELETNPGPASRDELKLRDELRNYEVQAGVLHREIERHRTDIAEYERRLENTPRRAAELAHLEASYVNLNEAIRGLQLKKVDADMGRALELSDKGERFRIVESATEPTSPVKPNRPLVLFAGIGLGLLTGAGLLVLREVTDSSFHQVQDLQRTLRLPVLAAVPVIELPSDLAGKRKRVWGPLRV